MLHSKASDWQSIYIAQPSMIKFYLDDWFDAGSLGCYKFLEGKVNLTWVEAQLACEQQGGYLAEPYSQLYEEQTNTNCI